MPESPDPTTILVTGAAGFIGARLVRRLVAAGRPVVGMDRVPPADDLGCPFHVADVADPYRLLVAARGCDGIVHAGGVSGPMLLADNPAEVMRANVMGTVNVLETARLLGIRRTVVCSSVSAYGATGSPDAPVTEATALAAEDVYGASKAAADLSTRSWAAQHGLDAVAMRLGWVYGPGRRTDGLIRPMLRSGLDAAPFRLSHGASQCSSWIHVDDVVDALARALDAPALPRRAYNVTSGPRISLAEVAARIGARFPDAVIEIGPGVLPGEPVQGPFDATAAKEDLGWEVRIGLDAGLEGYAAWLRDHPF